jgi:hypothetical protein
MENWWGRPKATPCEAIVKRGNNIGTEPVQSAYPVGGVEPCGAAADDADVERLGRGGGEAPHRPLDKQRPHPLHHAGEESQTAGHLGSAESGCAPKPHGVGRGCGGGIGGGDGGTGRLPGGGDATARFPALTDSFFLGRTLSDSCPSAVWLGYYWRA